MCGLAMIYKKHLNNPDVPPATRHAVTWIKDKILHGYYMTSMDDRYVGWVNGCEVNGCDAVSVREGKTCCCVCVMM